jgi:CRISPR-associated endonuclease/helicase Cas3
MNDNRLLAKSRLDHVSECDSIYLPVHLQDVYRSAQQVLATTDRWQLEAMGLCPEEDRRRLEQIVLVAAAIHDLGKANNQFQEVVRHRLQVQLVYHEWITVWLLEELGLGEWLKPALADPKDWPLVLWCVAGHHLRPMPSDGRPGSGDLYLLLDHADFRSCLDWLATELCLSGTLPAGLYRRHSFAGQEQQVLARRCDEWQEHWRTLGREHRQRSLLAAAKACLIAADAAGSAVARSQEHQRDCRWVTAALQQTGQGEILHGVVAAGLGGRQLYPFQERVAESKTRVTLLTAGCGTGKTLAAYAWAACQHPQRRLYFCYPTTGTATQGYADYLQAPEVPADLWHSRAKVDFAYLLSAPDGFGSGAADRSASSSVELTLRSWEYPVVACTVDQVLGLLQNHYPALTRWPVFAQGAFVFDEIHAYERPLFELLLRFLQELPGLPVLLMTASLQEDRRQALRQVVGDGLAEIEGPADVEQRARYLYRRDLFKTSEVLDQVREELAARGKILWVCNTVERAVQWYDRLSALGHQPLLYHSRFRYVDRLQRHRDVIEAFRRSFSPDKEVLAICTQVAEMSLDLQGVTLLVTELAPVPALIQRLGRLNRGPCPTQPRPFVVVRQDPDGQPLGEAPYDRQEVETGNRWLAMLPQGPISQQDLHQAWLPLAAANQFECRPSNWLDGGPCSEPGDVRSAGGLTIVLEQDEEALRRGERSLAEVALPMNQPPRSVQWQQWRRYHGVPIAPANVVEYSPQRGGFWRVPKGGVP